MLLFTNVEDALRGRRRRQPQRPGHTLLDGRRARSTSSAISPPSKCEGMRPSTRWASVTVGSSPPAP